MTRSTLASKHNHLCLFRNAKKYNEGLDSRRPWPPGPPNSDTPLPTPIVRRLIKIGNNTSTVVANITASMSAIVPMCFDLSSRAGSLWSCFRLGIQAKIICVAGECSGLDSTQRAIELYRLCTRSGRIHNGFNPTWDAREWTSGELRPHTSGFDQHDASTFGPGSTESRPMSTKSIRSTSAGVDPATGRSPNRLRDP